MTKQKIYKPFRTDNINMFPGDPTGSPDDFYFSKFVFGGLKWKKQ